VQRTLHNQPYVKTEFASQSGARIYKIVYEIAPSLMFGYERAIA